MPSPISHIESVSPQTRAGSRLRHFAALRARRPLGLATTGKSIVEGAPVSTGLETKVTEAGDYRFFAGWRSDPFYFDVNGALNNLQFTGDDYFTDKDVCSIVLELPNSALGSKKIGLWARTVDGATGKWVQADRGARSNQTPFLAGEANAAYLAAEPAGDAGFIPVFAHALEHAGGYTPADATRVAGTMLPDILHFDPARPVLYPENGRALTDDVVDFFLPLLTNGKVTQDNVGPHKDLLASFPYVGPPHKARSAGKVAA